MFPSRVRSATISVVLVELICRRVFYAPTTFLAVAQALGRALTFWGAQNASDARSSGERRDRLRVEMGRRRAVGSCGEPVGCEDF